MSLEYERFCKFEIPLFCFKTGKLVISPRFFLFEQTLADLTISFIVKYTVHKRCFVGLANGVACFCSSTFTF